MSWIQSDTQLARHPKLILFRKAMRWSKFESIGFLHCFWWTVMEYAPDGVISSLSPEIMADALGVESDIYARAVEVMKEVKFLDCRGEMVIVHDWIEYAGTYLRNTKYKRSPEKWEAICLVYRVSSDMSGTIPRQSLVPTNLTNQPTNQPTRNGRGSKWVPKGILKP